MEVFSSGHQTNFFYTKIQFSSLLHVQCFLSLCISFYARYPNCIFCLTTQSPLYFLSCGGLCFYLHEARWYQFKQFTQDTLLPMLLYNFSREEELVERAKELKVNAGTEPGADIGPVISKEVLVDLGISASWPLPL